MTADRESATAKGVTRNEWDRFWDSRQTVEEVYSNEKRVVDALLHVFSPQGKVILEVGAGSGRDSLELARAGATVVVLDYSNSALSLVRQNLSGSGNVKLVCADAGFLPLRDSCIDAVFHQGLLEHFREPSFLLLEQNRVLKEGGVVLVDVPQTFHIYTAAKHVLMAFGMWVVSWETQYTVGGLRKLLAANGFTPIYAYGEWMVPGLFYRGLRYVLLRMGVARLPLYPRGIPAFREISGAMRRWLRKRKFSLYTCFVIGVAGRKDKPPGRA